MRKWLIVLALMAVTTSACAQSADIITESLRTYYTGIFEDATINVTRSWAIIESDTDDGSVMLLVFESDLGFYYVELTAVYVNGNKELQTKYKIGDK